jgi:DNA-binding MarR family transcriptional regulator
MAISFGGGQLLCAAILYRNLEQTNAAHASGLLFNDLKQLCSLTDGNLSRHLGVLSEAGLIEIWKGTSGSRTQTMYRLTASGRQRFAEYISVLEKVIADAQTEMQPKLANPGFSAGWAPG